VLDVDDHDFVYEFGLMRRADAIQLARALQHRFNEEPIARRQPDGSSRVTDRRWGLHRLPTEVWSRPPTWAASLGSAAASGAIATTTPPSWEPDYQDRWKRRLRQIVGNQLAVYHGLSAHSRMQEKANRGARERAEGVTGRTSRQDPTVSPSSRSERIRGSTSGIGRRTVTAARTPSCTGAYCPTADRRPWFARARGSSTFGACPLPTRPSLELRSSQT